MLYSDAPQKNLLNSIEFIGKPEKPTPPSPIARRPDASPFRCVSMLAA